MRFDKKPLINFGVAAIAGMALCLQFGIAQQTGTGTPAVTKFEFPELRTLAEQFGLI